MRPGGNGKQEGGTYVGLRGHCESYGFYYNEKGKHLCEIIFEQRSDLI